MKKITNAFSLTGDNFLPELHLKQLGFTYSGCGPFTKHLERIQQFKEIGHLKYLYKNELDKTCFLHDVAFCNSEDLTKRIISDKILKYRAYEILGNRGYDRYQRALENMFYKLFDKKTGSGAIATSKAGASVNEQLAEELHKLITKKFKRRKVCMRFKDNTWSADLAEMESLPSKNKNVKYLLCAIDVFIKYVWVKPLKDKKVKRFLKVHSKV